MLQEVEAVYENGVLRLLSPVVLAESETVHVVIASNSNGRSERDLRLLQRARAEAASFNEIPSIEEIRRRLAVIPGNMSDDIISERGDY
jgi:predicted DNA-binding antitoxin AbrB/MazE fold protein